MAATRKNLSIVLFGEKAQKEEFIKAITKEIRSYYFMKIDGTSVYIGNTPDLVRDQPFWAIDMLPQYLHKKEVIITFKPYSKDWFDQEYQDKVKIFDPTEGSAASFIRSLIEDKYTLEAFKEVPVVKQETNVSKKEPSLLTRFSKFVSSFVDNNNNQPKPPATSFSIN